MMQLIIASLAMTQKDKLAQSSQLSSGSRNRPRTLKNIPKSLRSKHIFALPFDHLSREIALSSGLEASDSQISQRKMSLDMGLLKNYDKSEEITTEVSEEESLLKRPNFESIVEQKLSKSDTAEGKSVAEILQIVSSIKDKVDQMAIASETKRQIVMKQTATQTEVLEIAIPNIGSRTQKQSSRVSSNQSNIQQITPQARAPKNFKGWIQAVLVFLQKFWSNRTKLEKFIFVIIYTLLLIRATKSYFRGKAS